MSVVTKGDRAVYEVHCTSEIDDHWELRDTRVRRAAGRPSDVSVRGKYDGKLRCEHTWYVHLLQEAQAMMDRLNRVDDVSATFHERLSAR